MKNIVVLSTYPVYPRKHGGQMRVFHLYNQLGLRQQVTIVSFNMNDPCPLYQRRLGNITEISVLPTGEHQQKMREIQAQAGIPVDDIMMSRFSYLTPEFHRIANRYMEGADVLVAAQPYLFHIMEPYAGRKKLIYDSQNVEYVLKRDMLPASPVSATLLEQVHHAERNACERSDAIFTCSDSDARQMTELYRADAAKMVLVPNGVDIYENPYVDYETRQSMKRKLGLQNHVTTFIGSGHPPNVEAVRHILHFARQMPDVLFLVMGGVCTGFYNQGCPKNVILIGLADDDLKRAVFSISDIAVNPMANGSGTNLKIADYMANGVPVISTPVGVRGYNLQPDEDVIISDLPDFPAHIRILNDNPSLRQVLSRNGRARIEESYSWDSIARSVMPIL